MSDYETIAAAIRWIDDSRKRPSSGEVAAAVGLDEAGFQKLFDRWSGTAEVDWLPCLTLGNARDLLRSSSIAAAERPRATGSTGAVTLVFADPADPESASGGETITAGVADSPFGKCLLAESHRGIRHLAFFDEEDREAAFEELRRDVPDARLSFDDHRAARLAGQVFSNTGAPWPVHLRGTDFERRVWQALTGVRPGSLVSYGALAAAAGNPKASRATGSAVGANPVSFLIPCHRVIRESGVSGHYRWGAVRKRAMLAWEAARRTA